MSPKSAASPRTRMPRSQRRSQILGVAREVFAEQGYHNAAMDDIAERAGVSKPVLYQHFEGKMELYLAVLDETSAALAGYLADALQRGEGVPQSQVHKVVEAFFAFASEPGSGSALLFHSDLPGEPAVADKVAATDAQVAAFIADGLLDVTSLAPAQAHFAAALACAIPRTCATYWLDHPEVPESQAVAIASAMAWGALDVFPPAGTDFDVEALPQLQRG